MCVHLLHFSVSFEAANSNCKSIREDRIIENDQTNFWTSQKLFAQRLNKQLNEAEDPAVIHALKWDWQLLLPLSSTYKPLNRLEVQTFKSNFSTLILYVADINNCKRMHFIQEYPKFICFAQLVTPFLPPFVGQYEMLFVV